MSFIIAMFLNNTWLWFHILGGGIIAKILMIWFPAQLSFAFTLVIAICWEIIEYNAANVNEVYGSQKRFFADAMGDIFGACAMALVVVI